MTSSRSADVAAFTAGALAMSSKSALASSPHRSIGSGLAPLRRNQRAETTLRGLAMRG